MFKMVFNDYDNSLQIYLYGHISKKVLTKLEKKIYYYADEYGVRTLFFNTVHVVSIDRNYLCEVFDQYEMIYGGHVELIDTIYL